MAGQESAGATPAASEDMQPPEAFEEQVQTSTPKPRSNAILFALRHDYSTLVLLALTLLVNVALFGFLLARYDSLPDPLPLHFDAAGFPDRIEAKNGIMNLPVFGLIVIALNTVLGALTYRRAHAATVLLIIGALFVQLLMWLATINITGGL